jgi:hypothetical protein
LVLIQQLVGTAYVNLQSNHKQYTEKDIIEIGKRLLESHDPLVDELEITAPDFENSQRKIKLVRTLQAYHLFKELVMYYAASSILNAMEENNCKTPEQFQAVLPVRISLTRWVNAGGQLILQSEMDKLLKQVQTGVVKSWNDIHSFYKKQARKFNQDKLHHALASLQAVHGISIKKSSPSVIPNLLQQSITTREWMAKAIYDSRAKDYNNTFRKMVYSSMDEMNAVLGKLSDNSFIKKELEELENYKARVKKVSKQKSAVSH